MKHLLQLLVFITALAPFGALAQTGAISGEILDAASKEGVVGASVVIEGTTTGSPTDGFGRFTIKNLEPGTYTLLVTSIGYAPGKITGVVVKDGTVANINAALTEEVDELEGVVVTAARQTNTDLALLASMKGSMQLVSGVSAQMITKSQDRDAAQVIRRVPGITITDNRFINVRGLSSRYNTVLLNGTFAPSTELESRAFSFDVIPSSLLDQLMVYKSGGAENPGEFGGAVVKLATKNFVDENFLSLNVSGGIRSNTTFQEFRQAQGGSLDFLGVDDGSRALPQGLPADLNRLNITPAEVVGYTHQFNNNWGVNSQTASPDFGLRLDAGRRFHLGGVKVSALHSLGYSNSNQYNRFSRYRYENYAADRTSTTRFAYQDDRYANSVRLSALSNWAFAFSPAFKLNFRNFYTHTGLNETTERLGTNFFISREESNQSYRYAMRSILSSQLEGTYYFNEDRSSLSMLVGTNYSTRNEPDWKRSRSFRAIGSEDEFDIVIGASTTPQNAARFYMNFDELALSNGLDFDHRFSDSDKGVQLKAGYLLEYKERDFAARKLGYRIFNEERFDRSILEQPLEQIFAQGNLRTPDGLVMGENTNATDSYQASNLYGAAYGSATIPFAGNFKMVSGLRVEYNRQQLNSGRSQVDNPITSLLPSLNLTYNFTDKMLLRGAYYRTVNRPEFRELAPFSFYDFDFDADISGNEQLKTASIQNLDLRWELYPSASEVINVGVFYKHFTDAIEFVYITGTSNPYFYYENAQQAYSAGLELEIRKSLAPHTSLPVLQNMGILFNGSLIRSQVDVQSAYSFTYDRPLQGQSPYIINSGLFYEDDERGLQISAMYNVIGKRIFLVGDSEQPTVWEMPRHLLDLTFSKRFTNRLELKAGVSDLLNAALSLREDGNLDNKIDSQQLDKPILTTRNGSYFTLGFNYRF
ncbi:TonB-dependent receptor [Cesiribacter andamanensis]|uniref:Outer membrane cobalamin receptor protein n=1 Tax=Cesiribacter andamanensis AMV16 TaxID=1279009 RepID=M7NZ48_9BACT|nr:TonB-dependent receptor [Cesiribacter andamanensis]EMR03634.1 Outer membrane cobalamin receptor protein [Cesiribacter andamanensis AMV16]